MKAIFSILTLIIFTSCSVSIVQNTGRGADILEDNDTYKADVDADMNISPDVDATIPVSIV